MKSGVILLRWSVATFGHLCQMCCNKNIRTWKSFLTWWRVFHEMLGYQNRQERQASIKAIMNLSMEWSIFVGDHMLTMIGHFNVVEVLEANIDFGTQSWHDSWDISWYVFTIQGCITYTRWKCLQQHWWMISKVSSLSKRLKWRHFDYNNRPILS